MSVAQLRFRHQILDTDAGPALGTSYQWPGGQYCAIHTDRGMVACGLYDPGIASRFGMALAIARGTPEHPLREPEDLLDARIVEVSDPAAGLGVRPGMSGREALECLLRDPRGSMPPAAS